ncbi:hypothetical protein [Candidatus Nitrosocosmicus sp. SS]|jgi:hypothetical protein|uniref:hypothetical protein n=1 Tax=Candidatus Nitrosocosmicus agrestis TaxID=2563600 RepID=UPI00122E9CD8|nr:hypothetical protein [Candidatus Nitrosocosmicus sp. SS]KAA2283865.1 hypothetical protein F1Z66_00900 [Candidatus Nitrosocosmicus sp. SS]KAF0870241.1 hypothetical protein E5N71_01615 [Candidatus Nitrosocosmicus sp. SS]
MTADFEAWQEILEKWKQVNRMQDLNQRLYDELGSAIIYILEYSKRNDVVLPNRERLWKLVENIHEITGRVNRYRGEINNLPPKTKHPFSTPDEETEPRNWIIWY